MTISKRFGFSGLLLIPFVLAVGGCGAQGATAEEQAALCGPDHNIHPGCPVAPECDDHSSVGPGYGQNTCWNCDGTTYPQACTLPPIYTASFESGITGWTTWTNCATDNSSYVVSYYTASDNPAPGGGSYAMRIHTENFAGACAYPGTYALSPSIAAVGGNRYAVDNYSRNASNAGETHLIFFNSSGTELGASAVTWNTDAWQYNADPQLIATAPAGTVSMKVRYDLRTPNETADLDLLTIHWE
jgi:hypothetical protein